MIFTISRQYGSGGRYVGRQLAERLGVAFYDTELISLAAQKSGYSEKLFVNAEEQNPMVYAAPISAGALWSCDLSLNAKVFVIQSQVICEVAEQGPCVIVGRCADYVLRERADCIRVFLHSDLKNRIRRAVKYYHLPEDKAEEIILRTDKKRATYHNYYAGSKWGRAENYHLSLNTDSVGIAGAVSVLESFAREWNAKQMR